MENKDSGLKKRMDDFAFEVVKKEGVPTKGAPKKEEKK